VAGSTSEAVGDVAVAAASALGLATGTPPAALPVERRKTPGVPEGQTPTLPQVVVSVGEEGRVERLSATQKLKTYPAAFTIVTAGGRVAGDNPTVRRWRQAIEAKAEAQATWVGLAGFNRVTITNKPPFDVQALGKDFNYATVVAEVEVVEEHADA
jgi:hypothetical protein